MERGLADEEVYSVFMGIRFNKRGINRWLSFELSSGRRPMVYYLMFVLLFICLVVRPSIPCVPNRRHAG